MRFHALALADATSFFVDQHRSDFQVLRSIRRPSWSKPTLKAPAHFHLSGSVSSGLSSKVPEISSMASLRTVAVTSAILIRSLIPM